MRDILRMKETMAHAVLPGLLGPELRWRRVLAQGRRGTSAIVGMTLALLEG